ncbi:cytochrome c1 [Sphingomonas sp.]|jgi:ubiquinol-cytochrome c reductase cytochrome c1 subunit|uniref:cytochrome c1 n=1 Tax=Sphingomonas sp. TaxID=28214 RepID=UPI002E3333D5|nr:cytochrome c1 [Sphingomonas sp.]HEX4692979.1 cytochrome c1 [Sphingomonas sp.]
MVRGIAFLIGAAFAAVVAWALFWTIQGVVTDPTPKTMTGAPKSAETEFHLHPRSAGLRSDGVFGKFDKQQLQRGFQVYKEVCSNCHSLRFVAFRDLEGLGYSEGQVKAIAQGYDNIPSINPDTGEPATRKGTPADHFPMPFANDIAARAANNNAIPPDLSYITRARHGGADYVYSLITGYRPQSAAMLKEFPDIKTPKGLYSNPYFANLNIAMPPPLKTEGQVQYMDGTRPTVDQMAKDVAAFLVWTADPKLETRHTAGFAAVIFLLISSFLAFGAYRNIWRDVKH